MNTEFHYYCNYLITCRAGYSPEESVILANSSQLTDDNHFIYHIGDYTNYISQTENILKPRMSLLRIYPLFHFIPGNYRSDDARRKDGKMHLLNTTPGSTHARRIFRTIKGKNDLYSLGIACHAFVDTYAHQNFVGYYENFNSLKGVLANVSPNIGHADALTQPDIIGLVWKDIRLMNEDRDNNAIFLNAASDLFTELGGQNKNREELLIDLNQLFQFKTTRERIDFVRFLSTTAAYGRTLLPLYKYNQWLNECSKNRFFYRVPRKNFTSSHWYKFQEAVKDYQNVAWDILKTKVFSKMNLEKL